MSIVFLLFFWTFLLFVVIWVKAKKNNIKNTETKIKNTKILT